MDKKLLMICSLSTPSAKDDEGYLSYENAYKEEQSNYTLRKEYNDRARVRRHSFYNIDGFLLDYSKYHGGTIRINYE